MLGRALETPLLTISMGFLSNKYSDRGYVRINCLVSSSHLHTKGDENTVGVNFPLKGFAFEGVYSLDSQDFRGYM